MSTRPGLWVLRAMVAMVFAVSVDNSFAQRALSREEIQEMVQQFLPPPLKENIPALVENLLGAKLGPPISRSFDQSKAIAALFGRLPAAIASDCLRKSTPVGEPDQGHCVVSNGQEGGAGAYTKLAFSKNLAAGNLKFMKRPPVQDLDPSKLKPVVMGSAEADKAARAFLMGTFGVPGEELQPLVGGVPPPVRDLTIGFDKASGAGPVVIQKTVHLRRALVLPTPLVVPGTAFKMTHVAAPGKAVVAFDASGVVGAAVSDWQELMLDPGVSSRNAKTTAQLVQEIADDIFEEGGGPIATMRFQIVVAADWRGDHGLLLPAVLVFIEPVGRNLNEEQQRALAGGTTAGFVREYSLVNRLDKDVEKR